MVEGWLAWLRVATVVAALACLRLLYAAASEDPPDGMCFPVVEDAEIARLDEERDRDRSRKPRPPVPGHNNKP